MKKRNKKKIRVKGLLVVLLMIYLIVTIGYYLFNVPLKNIYVIGNSYLSDLEIIETAGVKNYPPLMKINSSKIKKNLLKLDIVESVKVRKSIFGKLTINVEEAHPLFFYRNDDKVYLSNGNTTPDNNSYLGIPYLINYVPKDILEEYVKKLSGIDEDVISLISEMEYSPDERDGISIDETRFILRMSDGNLVYVNTINLTRLNEYEKIYATIDDGLKGTLYLNSNRENVSFTSFESEQEAQELLEETSLLEEEENEQVEDQEQD